MTGAHKCQPESLELRHIPTPWYVEDISLWIVSDQVPKGRMHIADVRGWGYLTGKGQGALGMNPDAAFEIQKANAAFIVDAVNSHDAQAKALKEIEALSDNCVNAEHYDAQAALEDLQAIRSAIKRLRAGLTSSMSLDKSGGAT